MCKAGAIRVWSYDAEFIKKEIRLVSKVLTAERREAIRSLKGPRRSLGPNSIYRRRSADRARASNASSVKICT